MSSDVGDIIIMHAIIKKKLIHPVKTPKYKITMRVAIYTDQISTHTNKQKTSSDLFSIGVTAR